MNNKDAFISRWGHLDGHSELSEFAESVDQLLRETNKEIEHERALDLICVEGVTYKLGLGCEFPSIGEAVSAIQGELSKRWALKNKLLDQAVGDARELHFALSWLYDVVSEHCSVPDPQYSSVTNAAATITKFDGYRAEEEIDGDEMACPCPCPKCGRIHELASAKQCRMCDGLFCSGCMDSLMDHVCINCADEMENDNL